MTVTLPEVVPAATVTTKVVALPETIVALVPLNVTVLLAAVGLKPVPVMVMVPVTATLVLERLVMVGAGTTVKAVGAVTL